MADPTILRDSDDPAAAARQLLEDAIVAAESGQAERARGLLCRATAADPSLAPAWLWLGGLTTDPREALGYLERARRIQPDDPAVEEGIRWCKARIPQPPATVVKAPAAAPIALPPVKTTPVAAALAAPLPKRTLRKSAGWTRPALMGLCALVAVVVLWLVGAQAYRAVSGGPAPTATPTQTVQETIDGLLPQLNEVWRAGKWTVAISILERIHGLDPAYGGVEDWLATAYTALGREMAIEGRWSQSAVAFESALAAKPGFKPALDMQEAATHYLAGTDKYDAGDWGGAAANLQVVFAIDRSYRDVSPRLYQAYLRTGEAHQYGGDMEGAKAAYESALQVQPDGAEAEEGLEEVNLILHPPTPTPTPRPAKSILVDISEQHFYAYEGALLVYSWVCSTGEPGRDTKPGQFAIQSKIPEAYSYIWSLRMPYWLGIYWAGSTENGIHALPINPNGQTLWAGYLGSKVSFGCVILDTGAARQLFDWAEIGTPVTIRP